MMKENEVAFEWFERATYPSIRDIMEDSHRLPCSFEEWEKSAQAGEQALANSRHVVVRTIIEPHSFASWCREHDVKANAQSRLRYCKEQLANNEPSAEGGESSLRKEPLPNQASDPVAKGALAADERREQRLGPKILCRLRDALWKMVRVMRS